MKIKKIYEEAGQGIGGQKSEIRDRRSEIGSQSSNETVISPR